MPNFILEVKVQLPVWVSHTVEVEGEDLDDAIAIFEDNPSDYICDSTKNRSVSNSDPDDQDILDTEVNEDNCSEIE